MFISVDDTLTLMKAHGFKTTRTHLMKIGARTQLCHVTQTANPDRYFIADNVIWWILNRGNKPWKKQMKLNGRKSSSGGVKHNENKS